MDNKLGDASAPPISPSAGDMAAPPSYEQSMNHARVEAPVIGGVPPTAGGFVAPGAVPPGAVPPPPPPGSVQPPRGPTVVVNYVNPPNFGSRSVRMTCPHCQSQIQTSTSSEPGPMAWVLCAVLCVLGFWACACIPCCVESLNSVTHKCPNCNTFLGRYKGGM